MSRRVGNPYISTTTAEMAKTRLNPPRKTWDNILHLRPLDGVQIPAELPAENPHQIPAFDNYAQELRDAYNHLNPMQKLACRASEWWKSSRIGRIVAGTAVGIGSVGAFAGGAAFMATGGTAIAAGATYGASLGILALAGTIGMTIEFFSRRARSTAIRKAKIGLQGNYEKGDEQDILFHHEVDQEVSQIAASSLMTGLKAHCATLLDNELVRTKGPAMIGYLLGYVFERDTPFDKIQSDFSLTPSEKRERDQLGNTLRKYIRDIYTGPARTQFGPQTLYIFVCAAIVGAMKDSIQEEGLVEEEQQRRIKSLENFNSAYLELKAQTDAPGSKFHQEFDFRSKATQLKILRLFDHLSEGTRGRPGATEAAAAGRGRATGAALSRTFGDEIDDNESKKHPTADAPDSSPLKPKWSKGANGKIMPAEFTHIH